MDEQSLVAESIERAALADLHAGASPEVRDALGLQLEEIGGVLVSIARNDPSTVINRAIGLGVERPATREAVAAIVRRYAEAGVSRYYLHLHPDAQPSNLRDWLVEEGLEKSRGWMKFRRTAAPPPERTSELEVRRVGREHAVDFGRLAAAGFQLTERAIPLLASLVGRPGWHVYLSFAGATPAGTGVLFVKERIAWLDWASTHPGHRRKGGQGVVLAQRIRDAIGLGCRSMLTETGEQVEGDPQHSYKNIMRMGFEPAYLRENYVPSRGA